MQGKVFKKVCFTYRHTSGNMAKVIHRGAPAPKKSKIKARMYKVVFFGYGFVYFMKQIRWSESRSKWKESEILLFFTKYNVSTLKIQLKPFFKLGFRHLMVAEWHIKVFLKYLNSNEDIIYDLSHENFILLNSFLKRCCYAPPQGPKNNLYVHLQVENGIL